ncbi:hypothetical protein DPEC_G00083070 [Dallia pectoralis]|uniref:Uncharacterized protein n=1 Tax=Dallia pectoralis TaxID=75939 RepID=A0ACC2GYT4_DALPE|nr:hypothetical protein DPEC_G00083070 [Dallia pectoralis]
MKHNGASREVQLRTQGHAYSIEMAPKPFAPFAKRLFKGILLLEVAGVLGAYGLFHKMNSSQDFRNNMNNSFPFVLEVYYKSNEHAGVYGIREKDLEDWSKKA